MTDDNGQVVEYQYDPVGNRTQQTVDNTGDNPVNDGLPTQGTGNSLLSLATWPIGSAPAGAAIVSGWPTSSTYYNEARWARVLGPGSSGLVTAMETGQTQSDPNGGGVNPTSQFTINPTKGYEFSIYFRKYDLSLQRLYFGLTTGDAVKSVTNNSVVTNPYFLPWSEATQASNLDSDKWYKVVGFVLPEGYPTQSNSNWGGVYDLETGARVASILNYRWNEDWTSNQVIARFFTYYSEASQGVFTNYFYSPEVRLTAITFTPVVPALSITHVNADEGNNISFKVNLSAATTVDIKVNYVVNHPGGTNSASSNDYTAVSGTLVIPRGSIQGNISVATTSDTIIEADENIRLTLSAPVRATIAESSELALILDNDQASFSVNNVSVSEGGQLVFTVSKGGNSTGSHNVNYATQNGTAAAGSDYTSKSGTLTFSSTQTSKTVSVQTTEDSTVENNETVKLNLSSPTGGATISDSQGIGTIQNDDVPNSPPSALNDSYTIPFTTSPVSRYVLANDTDANGDDLTVVEVGQAGNAVITIGPGGNYVIVWGETPNSSGVFYYRASDGQATDLANVFLTLQGGGAPD